jgi:hypothetical protein
MDPLCEGEESFGHFHPVLCTVIFAHLLVSFLIPFKSRHAPSHHSGRFPPLSLQGPESVGGDEFVSLDVV